MLQFYHACDGDRTTLYCMMPYGVLAYTDFYGSILSFWVTVVSMARLPSEKAKSFLFMLAALAIALGVQWDRFNLWVQIVPIMTSLAIMGCAWVRNCLTVDVWFLGRARLRVESALWSHVCVIIVVMEDPPPWPADPPWLATLPPYVMDGWGTRPLR